MFINKLQSSITTYKAKNPLAETYYTDRRYYSNQSNDRNCGYNNSRYKPYQFIINRLYRYGSGSNRYNCNNRTNTRNLCFICKKPNCRSQKHTQKEQEAEKARFKAKNLNRFTNKAHGSCDFEKRFSSAYLQHVAEFEGKDNNSKDELGNAFATLLVDIKEEEVLEEQHSDLYFTLVEHLLIKPSHARSPYAKVLIKELNNQALIH